MDVQSFFIKVMCLKLEYAKWGLGAQLFVKKINPDFFLGVMRKNFDWNIYGYISLYIDVYV